ncbi:MAG TPA: hypothetical protein VHO25_06835, partial [Polyangiaceae bacterium]|nr:hypothetical protein [Polyangiaceae bacterium]
MLIRRTLSWLLVTFVPVAFSTACESKVAEPTEKPAPKTETTPVAAKEEASGSTGLTAGAAATAPAESGSTGLTASAAASSSAAPADSAATSSAAPSA